MTIKLLTSALLIALAPLACAAADIPATRPQSTTVAENDQSFYYWKATPVGHSAQLLTLFCRECTQEVGRANGLPVVSVLRDTLGDADPTNDRLTYVWLLSNARMTAGQKILSGVPFFYWRVGAGSRSINPRDTSPLLNLSAPENPVFSTIRRNLVQWTALDPLAMPVRAASRSYRSNELDNERLHISETISFLRNAPTSDSGDELTAAELNTLIARLELRKQLLGGLVSEKAVSNFGEQWQLAQERVRSRNWELLRQCAEKTGLYFESLNIGGAPNEYGILWYPLGSSLTQTSNPSAPIWKLLNISDPQSDARVQNWTGVREVRQIDGDGTLLPPGSPGTKEIQLVPLGLYSLSYPKLPLLLIDFRDKLNVRRHEMTQRSINEITAGVIGISHFTNWYYYVAADLYNFISSRHGRAADQSERLDSYAQFRADLFVDDKLPQDLRTDLEHRVGSLSINPLGATPQRDLAVAEQRYAVLEANSEEDGLLNQRLEKDRRAELARYGESDKGALTEAALHTATFGLYTHRASKDETTLQTLDRYRRAESQIDFLEKLTDQGTAPEVAYESARIQASISELRTLMPGVTSKPMIERASGSLERLRQLSRDSAVISDCTVALANIRRADGATLPETSVAAASGGVTAESSIRQITRPTYDTSSRTSALR